jgi:dihydroorotase
MPKSCLTALCFFFLSTATVFAQHYDIVIKGGHVIDPKNGIDATMDVAIAGGKILKFAKDIDAKGARQVVDASGFYVTPGLVDIHSHVSPDIRPGDPMPDVVTFRDGITTTVDAGTSGWKSFDILKKYTIDRSQTRVLAFLNIVGTGMKGKPEQDVNEMDAEKTAAFAKAHPDLIVGIKTAHFSGGWEAAKRAEAAARAANIPLMVDFGEAHPALSIDTLLLQIFRPGDIFTHCFAQLKSREFIVDTVTKKVKPFVWEAQKKGVIFDVGHGAASFAFTQAIPALKDGFVPNSISTDRNHGGYNGALKDLSNVMSKFLNLGMDIQTIIRLTTVNPAHEIKHDELGNLNIGGVADVAIFSIQKGNFGYFDNTGYKIKGDKKIQCEMTIRAGKIVYDLNGIANPIVVRRN